MNAVTQFRFRAVNGNFFQLFFQALTGFRHFMTPEERRLHRRSWVALLVFLVLCGTEALVIAGYNALK